MNASRFGSQQHTNFLILCRERMMEAIQVQAKLLDIDTDFTLELGPM